MSNTSVPVIDIAQLDSSATRSALDDACRDWGFFQVVEHGIAPETLAAVRSVMSQFFGQPTAQKNKIARSRENHWGFYDRELTKNIRDWKEIFDYGPAEGELLVPQWPDNLPEFEPAILDYYRACEVLCLRLLSAIVENLGASETVIQDSFSGAHTSFVRLNYYPPCPAEQGTNTLGINPHTDAGALTCLLQDDQAGLEILKDEHWHLIEPHADALVINIGDIVQVWSNDVYRAAYHRVVTDSSKARYSAPFFMNPGYAMNYAPLVARSDSEIPARYRPINWGEFRGQRASGDYADYGEEIQISHYQIEPGGS